MQTTDHVLMVRPCRFGYNAETAVNNAFQKQESQDAAEQIAARALEEFDAYVQLLRDEGVTVEVMQDSVTPSTPDSIFPNNCVSTHLDRLPDGTMRRTVVLYPMFAENRRKEITKLLAGCDSNFEIAIDLGGYESRGLFLEGTGSLILDRERHIAYACSSPRTSEEVVREWARLLGYRYFLFDAADSNGTPIYHTNVMMHVGTEVAVVCLDAIPDAAKRSELVSLLEESGKSIVEISLEQMASFAGNMLEVRSTSGRKILVMSAAAKASLTAGQLEFLESRLKIVSPDLTAIETAGGGSARCMLAEIY